MAAANVSNITVASHLFHKERVSEVQRHVNGVASHLIDKMPKPIPDYRVDAAPTPRMVPSRRCAEPKPRGAFKFLKISIPQPQRVPVSPFIHSAPSSRIVSLEEKSPQSKRGEVANTHSANNPTRGSSNLKKVAT